MLRSQAVKSVSQALMSDRCRDCAGEAPLEWEWQGVFEVLSAVHDGVSFK